MLTPVNVEWVDRESIDLEFRYVVYTDDSGKEYRQGVVTGPDGYLAISHFEADGTAQIDAWFDTLEVN